MKNRLNRYSIAEEWSDGVCHTTVRAAPDGTYYDATEVDKYLEELHKKIDSLEGNIKDSGYEILQSVYLDKTRV